MTIEEKVERHKQATHYIMTIAMTLGLWFIVEYLLASLGRNTFLLSEGRLILGLGTAALLFILLKHIRKKYFDNQEFSFMQGWYYCTQLMFFAGLVEALGILIFNNWIAPDNLAAMHEAVINELETRMAIAQEGVASMDSTSQVATFYNAMSNMMTENIEVLKETPISTPLQAAISNLSNDVMMGMLLGIPFALVLRKKDNETKNK